MTKSTLKAILNGTQKPPENGLVGFVDEVLEFCRSGPFRFYWKPQLVTVENLSDGVRETYPVTIRNSVMRAVVARLATLASRGRKEAINPYGGHGEIRDEQHPEVYFQIDFMNTEDEQHLEVVPVQSTNPNRPVPYEHAHQEHPAVASTATA
jgi:hypothetical protein